LIIKTKHQLQPIKKIGPIKLDASLIVLLFSNALTIILAITQHWNLITIMWIYWAQSVIIGIFNFIRILSLKDFSIDKLYFVNLSGKPALIVKIIVAFFFAFHYGFFHLAYFVFLIVISLQNSISHGVIVSTGAVLIGVAIFLANHLFSYILNRKSDMEKGQNIGRVMFFPYARIIPMHLTIIFGFVIPFGLIFFLILKTIADVIMHIVEHSEKEPASI
jgi:hypothetical protein